MIRRRAATVLLGAALAGTAMSAVAAPDVIGRAMQPRGTTAFQEHVARQVGTPDPDDPEEDEYWVAQHPEMVLAEGDLACTWLEDQPGAPDTDRSGAYSVDTLVRRYLSETETTRVAELSSMGLSSVVDGAWEHLCGAVREDRTAPMASEDD
jgi:hypothetical protein